MYAKYEVILRVVWSIWCRCLNNTAVDSKSQDAPLLYHTGTAVRTFLLVVPPKGIDVQHISNRLRTCLEEDLEQTGNEYGVFKYFVSSL